MVTFSILPYIGNPLRADKGIIPTELQGFKMHEETQLSEQVRFAKLGFAEIIS